MKQNIAAFVCGLIFSIGLGIAGMTDTSKVIGFLDLFGKWDPTLVFVMMGAIGVHLSLSKVILQRKSPLLATEWHVPHKRNISKSLLLGSALFGIGWGMEGYCPGPGIVSLTTLEFRPFVFVFSMIAGMVLFKIAETKFGLKKS